MEQQTQTAQSFFRQSWRMYRKNRVGMVCLCLAAFIVAVAIGADLLANDKPLAMKYQGHYYFPLFKEEREFRHTNFRRLVEEKFGQGDWALFPPVPFNPTENDLARLDEVPAPPNRALEHFLGTDDRGRDVLSRMIHGARTSLLFATVVVIFDTLGGILVGGLMGYCGGLVDLFFYRVMEILSSIPTFFLLLTLLAFFPPNMLILFIVFIMFDWIGAARFTRAEFLKIRKRDYVEAARAIGVKRRRLLFRHILPNAMAPLLVLIPFDFSGTILSLSVLSFLGFGVPPPTADWGELLQQAKNHFDYAWWLAIFPGMLLFFTLTVMNFIGESIRDATDPMLKGT